MGSNRGQRLEVDAAEGLDAVRSRSFPLSPKPVPHIYCRHVPMAAAELALIDSVYSFAV